MAWEAQGRQEHGWFGHGTGPDKLAERAVAVSRSVVAALPRGQRAVAGDVLAGGAEAALGGLLAVWARHAGLDRQSFAARFLNRDAGDAVAEGVQGAALAIAHASGQADLRAAADSLARALMVVGVYRWNRFTAEAERLAADAPPIAGPIPLAADAAVLLARTAGRPQAGHGQTHHGSPAASRPAVPARAPLSPEEEAALRGRNIYALAKIIQTEANGLDKATMTAVGCVVHNRMLRNHSSAVADERHAFQDFRSPTDQALSVARDIIDGGQDDTTKGATHFYTPHVGGHAPNWANSPGFEPVPVPSVEKKNFLFYRQRDNGKHARVLKSRFNWPCIAHAVILALLLTTAARSASISPSIPLTLDTISAVLSEPCTTEACNALRQVMVVIEIFARSNDTPMRLGGITDPAELRELKRRTRPTYVRRQVQRALFDHPERFAAQCAIMHRLAATFKGGRESDAPYDLRDMIDIAEMIDARRPMHCLDGVLNAIPDRPETADVLDMASNACLSSYWSKSGCGRIKVRTFTLTLDTAWYVLVDHCTTEECIALRPLFNVMVIMGAIANTWTPCGRVAARKNPAEIMRYLKLLLFDHPERFVAQCSSLRRLAATFKGSYEVSSPVYLRAMLNVAELIDTRRPAQCLDGMLTVIPDLPDTPGIIVSARKFCLAGAWTNPGCQRIQWPAATP